MTTEEKLDVLVDTVNSFVKTMNDTIQSVAAIIQRNNTPTEEQTFEVDGQMMTLTEYQNMILKKQLDAQYEDIKLREHEAEVSSEVSVEEQVKEGKDNV